MKIVCDCGNEAIITTEEHEGEQLLHFNKILNETSDSPFLFRVGFEIGEWYNIKCNLCNNEIKEDRRDD